MILSPYKNGDEIQILSLFSQCFSRHMPESLWWWRFRDNPLDQIFIQLAWDEQVLASHYAVSPVLLSMEENDYLTSLSMTTMTHPQYRGLKLFPKLASHVYDQISRSDHLMVWGFPNSKSHRIFTRYLNWNTVYEIPNMQLKVDFSKKRDICDYEIDDHFNLDYIYNYCSNQFIHVKKDRQYLRWRYAENPLNHYTNLVISKEGQVSSFCIIKKYLNAIDIVDFQAHDADEGEELLNRVVSLARKNDFEYINCWAPRHHFFHSLCEKMGFINKEPITYLGFRQLSKNKLNKISDNYSDWYIQMGDSDVY